MLSPAKEDYDDEEYEDDIDYYKDIQFFPVEKDQKKQLYRAIWDDIPYALIFLAFIFLISIIIIRFTATGTFLYTMGFLISIVVSLFSLIFGLPCTIFCLLDMKKNYESYIDIVKDVWEENEELQKTKNNEKKTYFSLTKSQAEKYPNPKGYKVGDRIRIFKSEKGEILIIK